jgi:hypothetical protein
MGADGWTLRVRWSRADDPADGIQLFNVAGSNR